MRNITTIVIHCSATPPNMDIGAAVIRAWHTDPKRKGGPLLDIGYHAVVRRDGVVEAGRDETIDGAHVGGHNHYTLGLCLVGGTDADDKQRAEFNYTFPQIVAARSLIAEWVRRYPIERICGHRDLDSGKACPVFDAGQLFGDLLEVSGELGNGNT